MTASSMTPAPLLDLSRLVAGIRWRRRLWASLAVLGLLAGAVLTLLLPPKPTAVVELLIVRENDVPAAGQNLIATDVALFSTTRLAKRVLERLESDERPEDFRETYEIVGLTANMIELAVAAGTGAEAMRRADALANTFIEDHIERTEGAVQAEVDALRKQRDLTTAELAKVDAAIATATSAGEENTATELNSLYASRADLVARAAELGRRAEDTAVGAPRVSAGTQIVDGPRLLRERLLVSAAGKAVVGFLFGLAAGLGLAAVATVVADRPVLRRDISANLGGSVLAQLRGRTGHGRLTRRLPRGAELRGVAATLARVATDARPSVSVLELGCPKTAASLALSMAESMAIDHPAVVIDDLPHRELRKLTKKVQSPIRVIDGAEFDAWPSSMERVIGVGSVQPGATWTDLRRLGSETVLVVRAGHASAAWLHTVARQLADAGITVLGVVVAHPDPRDRTDGTLWDALHTAVRGRMNAQRIAEVS